MKKLLLPAICLLSLAVCSSAIAQSVVSPAGGTNQNSAMVLEWTLGEMMVETIADTRGLYTQGFHQPLLIKKTRPAFPLIELLPDNLFVVAPNPTVSEFSVRIDSKYGGKVQLQLTDASGRNLQLVSPSLNRSFRFNLSNQPSGTYYLIIRNEQGRVIRNFSVIKAN